MKKRLLLTLLVFVIFIGCKKENSIEKITARNSKAISKEQGLLITLNFGPSFFKQYSFHYVITNLNGDILKVIKYNNELEIPVNIEQQEKVDLFNIYEVGDYGASVQARGFFHLKKGTKLNVSTSPTYSSVPNPPVTFHLQNIPEYDQLTSSTNYGGSVFRLNQIIPPLFNNYFNGSKFFVQYQKGDSAYFNFYDIKPVDRVQNIDLIECKNLSIKKTIKTLPGPKYCRMYGHTDIKTIYDDYYLISEQSFNNGKSIIDVFYPKNKFGAIQTIIEQSASAWPKFYKYYTNQYWGNVPDNVDILNADITLNRSNITDFDIEISEPVTLYKPHFSNYPSQGRLAIANLLLPPNVKRFRIPDIFKASNINDIKITDLKLKGVDLFQIDCKNFPIPDFFDINKRRNFQTKQEYIVIY